MLESCNSIFDNGLANLSTTIYVKKTGNDLSGDGSFDNPYLTVQKGLNEAYNLYAFPSEPQNPLTYIRPAVEIGEGVYNDGNIILPPQVQLLGCGIDTCEIIGDITIDSKWSNYIPVNILNQSDLKSSIIFIQVTGNINIDFDTYESNQGRLSTLNCRFIGTFTVSQKVTNVVGNSYYAENCTYSQDITFNGIPVLLKNCSTISWLGALMGIVTLNQVLGSAADNYFETCGGNLKNVVVNGNISAAPPYYLVFDHQIISGATLTINGKYAEVKSSVYSIPESADINLLGGAVASQIFKFLPFPEPKADWNEVDVNSPNYILNKPTIPSSAIVLISDYLWLVNVQKIETVSGIGYQTIFTYPYAPSPFVIDGKRRRINYICNYSKSGGNATIQFRININGLLLTFPSLPLGGAAIMDDTFVFDVFINFRAANEMYAAAFIKRFHPNNDVNDAEQNLVAATWDKTLTNNVSLEWQILSGSATHTFTILQSTSELL